MGTCSRTLLVAVAVVVIPTAVDAEDICLTEITTVTDFYRMKCAFDLILDVRTLSEYVGDGDEACNEDKADKCNMGHDPDSWMLTNEARSDKAVVFEINGSYEVDPKIVESLWDCYGDQASTVNIAVLCRTGPRSKKMQSVLVAAGFACGSVYTLGPGVEGLFQADPSKLVKGNEKRGPWFCPVSSTTTTAAPSKDDTPASADVIAPWLAWVVVIVSMSSHM